MRAFGLSADVWRAAEKEVSPDGPKPVTGWNLKTPNLTKAVEHGMAEAKTIGADVFASEHLLFGILSVPNCKAVQAIEAIGVSPKRVRDAIRQALESA